MTSLTITARQLRNLVTPLYPHTCAERLWAKPVPIEHIRLWTTPGHVCAWATDRFTVGITRDKVDGVEEGFETYLTVTTLKQILTIFKTTRTVDPVLTITPDGHHADIAAEGGLFTSAALRVEAGSWAVGRPEPDVDRYPDLAAIIGASESADLAAAPVSYNPSYLARFSQAQRQGDPISIRMPKPPAAAVVAVGEHFLGAIMAVRGDAEGHLADNRWLDVFMPGLKPAGADL